MKKETIRKLVLSAMFAALCCVATLVVQIPIATGYLNVGEGMCLLSGLVLGPWYGMAAAGLGSGLADLLAGYGIYVPATLVIKALVALTAAQCFQLLRAHVLIDVRRDRSCDRIARQQLKREENHK